MLSTDQISPSIVNGLTQIAYFFLPADNFELIPNGFIIIMYRARMRGRAFT